MLQLYDNNPTLKNNQLYSIKVKLGSTDYAWSFTSRYSPYYSTPKLVRNSASGLADDFTDEEINFMIWQVSLFVLTSWPSTKVFEDYTYKIRRYVSSAVALNMATEILISKSLNVGSEEKDLGDLKVIRDSKAPQMARVLKGLQDDTNRWYRALFGARALAQSAVRGYTKHKLFAPSITETTSAMATDNLLVKRSSI